MTVSQAADIEIGAETFWEPVRLVQPTGWAAHIPFAFWLVKALKPATFVELGTHSGNSYAAFCQAISTLGLPTRAYAIDTWKGDEHAGFYGDEVYSDLAAFNARHFARFSTLVRSSFAAARPYFADASVDLLHIDGMHSYEAVRSDFDTWAATLSESGVAVFHDTNVRERGFGVWRLWQELSERLPSFEFDHSHGLGVLGVGARQVPALARLFDAGREAQSGAAIRRLFASRGAALVERMQMAEREEGLRGLLAEREERLSGLLADREARLEEVSQKGVLLTNEIELLGAALVAERTAHSAQTGQLADLAARHEELASERQKLASQRHELVSQVEELEARSARLELVRQTLQARVASLEARNADLTSHTASLSRDLRAALQENDRLEAEGLESEAAATRFSERYTRLLAEVEGRRPRDALKALRRSLWRRTRAEDLVAIRRSAFFDRAFYLRENPDVAADNLDPVSHYLRVGGFEGRDPGPHFSTLGYLAQNPDVEAAGVNALAHYELFGRAEGRSRPRRNELAPPEAMQGRFDAGAAGGPTPSPRQADGVTGALRRLLRRDASRPDAGKQPRSSAIRLRVKALGAPGPVDPTSDPVRRPLLLCLTHAAPWPPRAGNEYRIDRLLEWRRGQGWDVVLLYCPLPGETPDKARLLDLAARYPNLICVGRDGVLHCTSNRLDIQRAVSAMDGRRVRDVGALLNEASDPVSARVLRLMRDICPDVLIETMLALNDAARPSVVLANYVFMGRGLPLLGGDPLKIIDTHDVFSTKLEKVAAYGVEGEITLSELEERALLSRADLVLAIQPNEALALRRIVPDRRVVTAGVDACVVTSADLAARPVVLVVGSRNAMNVKGLEDFLRLAWPRIADEVPGAELHIVGSVGKAVMAAGSSVKCLGGVDRIAEAYASARVVINPAIAGTGLKIKTLEALAHLRPIVVWPAGVDGMPPELRDLCECVADWFEFSESVITLLRTTTRHDQVVAARARIAECLSPGVVYAELDRELSAVEPAASGG